MRIQSIGSNQSVHLADWMSKELGVKFSNRNSAGRLSDLLAWKVVTKNIAMVPPKKIYRTHGLMEMRFRT